MRKCFWDFDLDGGGVGGHLLRGAQLGYGVFVLRWYIVTLEDVTGTGALVDLGWASNHQGIAADIDFDGVPAAPRIVMYQASPYPTFPHAEVAEPILMTVHGAALTAGYFAFAFETLRY